VTLHFQKQITLKVPDFKLYSHSMTSILVADQEQHLSLTKMQGMLTIQYEQDGINF
jgi:hypothetical protein